MLEGMLNDICGVDLFAGIFETLSINWFGSDGGAALTIVKTLYGAVQPVAVLLMFIYFMIAVVDKLSSENFTWEQLWRQMAMLLVSKYLIEHGFEILDILFDVGMSMAATISKNGDINSTAGTFDAAQLIEDYRKSAGMDNFFLGWMADIWMGVCMLFPWLLSWIMGLVVSVICYSRIIEIYARAVFAPIAISDFFHSGLQSSGWRFLKNFLAVCLQGAMILVIAIIYSKLIATFAIADKNLFTFIGKYLAFYAAALMLMFKSLSLTKELVGTN